MTTASSVPIWLTAVKAAPGSGQLKKAANTRRWALEETGRNSVSPWMRPRTTASRMDTELSDFREGPAQGTGARPGALGSTGTRGHRECVRAAGAVTPTVVTERNKTATSGFWPGGAGGGDVHTYGGSRRPRGEEPSGPDGRPRGGTRDR